MFNETKVYFSKIIVNILGLLHSSSMNSFPILVLDSENTTRTAINRNLYIRNIYGRKCQTLKETVIYKANY